MPTTTLAHFGNEFGNWTKKEMSQEKLAEDQGFIRHTSVVLSAANETSEIEIVVKLARALKVDAGQLFRASARIPADCEP